MNIVCLGRIEIDDKCIIADPAYEPEMIKMGYGEIGTINCLPGNWEVFTILGDRPDQNKRVLATFLRHESLAGHIMPTITEMMKTPPLLRVGVDSAQLAIIDQKDHQTVHLLSKEIGYNPIDVSKNKHRSAIIKLGMSKFRGGVVTTTGFGDGAYLVYVEKDGVLVTTILVNYLLGRTEAA